MVSGDLSQPKIQVHLTGSCILKVVVHPFGTVFNPAHCICVDGVEIEITIWVEYFHAAAKQVSPFYLNDVFRKSAERNLLDKEPSASFNNLVAPSGCEKGAEGERGNKESTIFAGAGEGVSKVGHERKPIPAEEARPADDKHVSGISSRQCMLRRASCSRNPINVAWAALKREL